MKVTLLAIGLALVVLTASGGLLACTSDTVTTASSTSTTLAPGQMTFDTLTQRFERLVGMEDLPGTLPYTLMTAEEIAWIWEATASAEIEHARGYRFTNGDLVILFFLDPKSVDSGDKLGQTLAARAEEEYLKSMEGVWAFADGDFGYVVVSDEYRADLGRLAHWARAAHELLFEED